MDIRGETRAHARAGTRQPTNGDRAARTRSGHRRESRDYRTRPTVTVVIPTLNEAENLPHVLNKLPSGVNELIVVDGHSTDETVRVARELRPDARVVLQDKEGKGNALACGFAAARGDIIVTVDADGSTDPEEIPAFIAPLIDGADFVKGSRYMRGGGSADITRIRSAGNRALGASVNLLFGTRYTDLCYGFSAFWRRCLPQLQVTCDGFEVETVINVRAAKAGLDVVEVPSYERDRIHGLSNLNACRDGSRALRAILRERLSRLPAPSDDWKPEFAEVAGSAAVPAAASPAPAAGSRGEPSGR
ncbi:MAG TPA: glycosyltransferase family 2 protein, partial [Solirubrobacteraceae bacterium]|nr:glycosyltransferase family 2 protein [Solirubrobacteraceae bacterium]